MTRLTDLEEVRAGLIARMADCASDQNYAVLGRLLVDVVKQIAELEPPADGVKTGLSEFEKRLRDRESGAKTPHSAVGT